MPKTPAGSTLEVLRLVDEWEAEARELLAAAAGVERVGVRPRSGPGSVPPPETRAFQGSAGWWP